MDTATSAAIKAALLKLDHGNDDHWTTGGKPAMKVVEEFAGQNVTRAQVEEVAPDFERVTDEAQSGNRAALTAVAGFDSIMGIGDSFVDADVDLAANAKDGDDFWRQWIKAHDPEKLHKRPYHMLSRIEQARIAVFLAVAKD
ncbi:hypothetical protein [Pelagibacterium luteolum]|uniref:Uncharacterized protein n=1 Tax=Pelagibacterium luteolum TaxID=440168 RepID=A0A1G7ZI17_9HYPH|nr:hypothetical protein [Pelagibacterium luteolum]SDH08255.1 hypothetical protein SAMN04487974_12026 [Pelagibacterium luteolum]